MYDIQSFAFFALRVAAILGTVLRGWIAAPVPALPMHACGTPPAVISGNNSVDDWMQDPMHPIGYIAYPAIASRHNEQGMPIVTVCIMPDGWVGDVELKSSSGSAQLDAVTLISAGNWHFLPARGGINGVPEWVDIGVRYAMRSVPAEALPVAMGDPPAFKSLTGKKTPPISDPAFPQRVLYPALAIRRSEEGSVLVNFDIEEDGWPSQVHIIQSSGSQQLDAVALAAVGGWHFFPATQDGKPTRVRYPFRVVFKLRGAPAGPGIQRR